MTAAFWTIAALYVTVVAGLMVVGARIHRGPAGPGERGRISMSDSGATDAEPDDGFRGPTQIGYATMPGRGTSYWADYDGHKVNVYITEKAKRVRIHVDGQEWKPVKPATNEGAS